jgi:hypothetical protein
MLCELIDALDGLDCSDESFEDCADEIFQIIKDINEELHPRSRRKPKPRKRSKPTKMAPSSQGPLVTVVNKFQASMRESARRLLSIPGSTYQRPE